jgi:muconate cycloisomerase
MVKIKKIKTFHITLPKRRTHKWTGLTGDIGGYVIVCMTGDNGMAGWGEAPVIKDWGGDYGKYFGETPEITKHIIETYLAPAVVGIEAGNFAAIHMHMDMAIKGYPYAKSSMEMAAYDLTGRYLGVPVHMLLGGRLRERIPVTHSIGLLPIEEAVKECVQVVNEGIKTIKIKVGVDKTRDIEMVRRVRDAVGKDIDICVDANCGYASAGEAIKTIKAMEPFGLKYAEQPVEGLEHMAEVARVIDTPIMADESAWTPHDALEIIERGAADIISIYTTKPGGLYKAMQVAAIAHAAGLPCNVNGSIETGVGNLANIHLAAAAPSVKLSCVVPISTPAEAQKGQLAGIYYNDDLIKAPFNLKDGAIKVPESPGMGIDTDEEKIKRYEVNRNG